MKTDRPARVFIATAALLLLACAASPALAQYVWTDKNGRKVFSDRPPTMDVPERNIVRQPGMPRSPDAPARPEAPVAPGAAAPVAPRAPAKEGELEEKRRQAETAEATRQKADEARQAVAKADNCQRARQAQASLDSGVRIAQVNAQGERSFMDEQTRQAETQRTRAIIASDCG